MNADNLSYIFLDAIDAAGRFFETGGPVLYLIAGVSFVMWLLILERTWYYVTAYKHDARHVENRWRNRIERGSWYAYAVRNKLISEIQGKLNQNLAVIKTLIAVCPLFGLLGTVTGMIEVFTVLAITGGGDAKSMAAGVSRATIPTMAGMVVALSGVFANIYIKQKAARECQLIEEHLTMDH